MKTKSFIKMMVAFLLIFTVVTQKAKAESAVYVFVDFVATPSEYVFTLNGEESFTLTPEVRKVWKSIGRTTYKKVMRKVIFKNTGSYVLGLTCVLDNGRTYNAEINLNLEDDGTYYVLINSTLKRAFYIEALNEKDGENLIKKAKKDDKYTINEDFVYEGK